MNKFILKLTLSNDIKYSLSIEIIYWDKRFICDNDNYDKMPFCYFKDSEDFSIYSFGDGNIREDHFEVPEYKYMHDKNGKFIGTTIKKDFYNEDKRYFFLKNFYRCLSEWSIKYRRFREDKIQNDKMILNGNYWIK